MPSDNPRLTISEERERNSVSFELPQPSHEAIEHSEKLIAYIKDEITAAGGRITFEQFMALTLYAPGLGYYSAGKQKFGKSGDFVTAPEVSSLFSFCLARQCQQIMQQLPVNDTVILEVGAGSGIMAADVLSELERLGSLPQSYFVLELSAELRQHQHQTIQKKVPHLASIVSWLDELPQKPFYGLVLANELLDAMPVHRFRMGNELEEYYVAWNGKKFVWDKDIIGNQNLKQALYDLGVDFSFGYESEINLSMRAWVKSVSEKLISGAAIVIDYGFPRHEYYHPQRRTGTLRCHYRHRAHDDPFVYPGLQDITAHVDFTAVAEAARETGLHVAGYNTQGFFLMSTGVQQFVANSDPNDTAAHLQLSQQIKTLTLPSEMGELFKVMAMTRGIEIPLMGFELQDLRDRL